MEQHIQLEEEVQRLRSHVGLESFSSRVMKTGLPNAVSFLTRKGKKNRSAKPTTHAVFSGDDSMARSSVERGFHELEA